MTEKLQNLIFDRTFDASCVKRAGDEEWATQILNRLKATHPAYTEYIDRCYMFYCGLPNSEMFTYRIEYMTNNKSKLKLRYK